MYTYELNAFVYGKAIRRSRRQPSMIGGGGVGVNFSDRPLAGLDSAIWRGEKLPRVEGCGDGQTMSGAQHDRVALVCRGGQASGREG